MNKIVTLLLLILLTTCSVKPVTQASIPTRTAIGTSQIPMPPVTRTVLPTFTETLSPDAYPYPVNEPAEQATPNPAAVTQTYPPTPTQTTIPAATAIRPTATFPSALASLKIVFSSRQDKTISIWHNSETKPLADLEEGFATVSISSDGEIIVYKQASGLWAVNADGTEKRLLVGKDDLQVANPNAPQKKSLLRSCLLIRKM